MSRSKPWNHHHDARLHVGRGVRSFHGVRAVQPEHGTRAIVWMHCIAGTPRFCHGENPRSRCSKRLTDPGPSHSNKMSCKQPTNHQHCAQWLAGKVPQVSRECTNPAQTTLEQIRQCRRIEVQSKETSMAPGVQPGLEHGGSRGARKHCRTASGGHPSLDWLERLCRGTATASRPRGQIAGIGELPAWWPGKAHWCSYPRHALQKNGGLANQWYMDDGDIMCHPILVLPFLQHFHVANAKVGAQRNPLKTEVIHYVNDLDAAPLEWKIGDVRSLAKTSAVTGGSITLGVAVGSLGSSSRPGPEQGRCHPRNARARPALPGSADRVRPLSRKSGRQPYQPHPAGSRPQNPEGTTGGSGLR